MAVLAGKNLIKEQEELHQIIIYEILSNSEFHEIKVKNLPEQFREYSKTFEFFEKESDMCLLLISRSNIVKYNYITDKISTIYNFKNELADQPDYVVFDESQQYAIIASTTDVLWIGVHEAPENEIDIDDMYLLADIKCLLMHDNKFYVLANKCNKKLGYFLL